MLSGPLSSVLAMLGADSNALVDFTIASHIFISCFILQLGYNYSALEVFYFPLCIKCKCLTAATSKKGVLGILILMVGCFPQTPGDQRLKFWSCSRGREDETRSRKGPFTAQCLFTAQGLFTAQLSTRVWRVYMYNGFLCSVCVSYTCRSIRNGLKHSPSCVFIWR